MRPHNNTPEKSFGSRQAKDKHFKAELQAVYEAFYEYPATMRMVEVSTGILRPNICRHVATLRDESRIFFVKKGYCPYTHHLAGFYTTDPKLFPSGSKNGLYDDNKCC